MVGATWVAVPRSSGGTPGVGPARPTAHDSNFPFNPQGEFWEFMQVEAHSPPELLCNEGHVVQWGPFFDGQCFVLLLEEVVKEQFPHPHPFRLPEGGLNVVFIIDLEHMLKVLPPPTAAEFCHQQSWVRALGLCTAVQLRLGGSRGGS